MVGGDCEGSVGLQSERDLCVRAGSQQTASQFLNPVSTNLKKLPQMPANRFLKIVQETCQIPVYSLYLPVSTSRNHPVESEFI